MKPLKTLRLAELLIVFSMAASSANANITGPVTIDFTTSMALTAYAGKADLPLDDPSGLACSTTTAYKCIEEDGMTIGTMYDGGDTTLNSGGHLHRIGSGASREIQYHADSAGIFGRATDFTSFSLDSFVADTRFQGQNFQGIAPDTIWVEGYRGTERLLHSFSNNGTLQIVALTEDFFRNIDGFHIYFDGYPVTPSPTSGADFELRVDNINVSAAVVPLPSAAYFLASGLLGVISLARRNSAA